MTCEMWFVIITNLHDCDMGWAERTDAVFGKLDVALVFHEWKASSFGFTHFSLSYCCLMTILKIAGWVRRIVRRKWGEFFDSVFSAQTCRTRKVLVIVVLLPFGLKSRSLVGFCGIHLGSGWPCSHMASDILHLTLRPVLSSFSPAKKSSAFIPSRTLSFKPRGWQLAAGIETGQLSALQKLVKNSDD